MNLYDQDDGFQIFTLEQANAVLPKVISKTRIAISLLDAINQNYEQAKTVDAKSAKADRNKAIERIWSDWSRDMRKLGAYPKGQFTVDFKSTVPNTLLCWTFGEHEIKYTHKTTETFKDRVVIIDTALLGFEGSLN